MTKKRYLSKTVLDASRERISKVFDDFPRIYISFSGGKDSSVMTHLVMDEAIKRNKKVGLLIIDLEAQYVDTIKHVEQMVDLYEDHIELHWICAEMLLRNAVSNYEPRWICWDETKKDPFWQSKVEQTKTPGGVFPMKHDALDQALSQVASGERRVGQLCDAITDHVG